MIFDTLKKAIKHFLLQKKFPESKIYYGVSLDRNSKLGKYSIVFSNTILINSNIGDYSYIQKDSEIINVRIGKFCSIARNVTIGLASHPINLVSTYPAFYDNTQPLLRTFANNKEFESLDKGSIINDDVWIGQNVMIKSGVTIGVGAVIGAGAVVTKDVESYSVVAGVPAKHIKYRFDKVTREKLLFSKWWEFDEKKLEKLAPYFNTPEIFLDKLKEFDEI